MSINTCDRCDRELKDQNAKYGWRCEKIMGGGGIYYQVRSPAKAPDTDGGGQSYSEAAADEFLSTEEKYTTFAKEFIFEAVWITLRNSGGSIWHLPEYMEQAKGILSTLKALFTGELLPADFIVELMENALEGIGGDIYFVLTHLEWYDPNTQLTKAETVELAKRTARAWEEGAQLAMILYGAVKNAMARKAGTAAIEGGGKLTGSLDKLSQAERQMVDDLLNQGKNVEIVPRSNIQDVQTPDFKINGVSTELKTLTGSSLNTPVTRIQEAFKQGKNVILDARLNPNITPTEVGTIFKRLDGIYKNGLPGEVEIWTNYGIFRR